MRKSWLIALVIILVSSSGVWGDTRLEVTGNRLLSADDIVRLAADDLATGNEIRAIKSLQEAYYSRGYLQATFRFRDRGGGKGYLLEIEEGEQTRIGTLRVTGSSRLAGMEVQHIMGVAPGADFNPSRISEGIETLLGYYDAVGYPFAQVWLDTLALDAEDNSVDMSIFVMEGGEKQLSRVVITGLEKTREEVAVKLSGLKVGQVYSGKEVKRATTRLRRFNVFRSVSPADVILSPDGKGAEAHIVVEEPKRVNSFSAAIGFADRDGDNPRVISGVVDLDLINIGGALRDLSVFWTNDGAGRSDTQLRYHQGFVFGRALGIGLSLQQIGLDTLYTWQSVGFEASAPISVGLGSVAGARTAFHADRNVFSEGTILRSWRFRILAGLSYAAGGEDGVNDIRVYGDATYARKTTYLRESDGREIRSQFISDLGMQFEISLGSIIRLHNETVYRGLESDEELVPLSEQFYIGGAATLRGYRENQFHGRRVAFSRWELHLGTERSEHVYLFADGGYVFQEVRNIDGEVENDDVLRAGYGFGLRAGTRVGYVDLSFGIGEKPSLQQTKVHVIVKRIF